MVYEIFATNMDIYRYLIQIFGGPLEPKRFLRALYGPKLACKTTNINFLNLGHLVAWHLITLNQNKAIH